jgi:hypothetical protein
MCSFQLPQSNEKFPGIQDFTSLEIAILILTAKDAKSAKKRRSAFTRTVDWCFAPPSSALLRA